jgi:hypothetical protein
MLTRVSYRGVVTAAVLVVLSSPLLAQQKIRTRPYTAPDERTYMPPAGYVPDAATAIKIAVAVWEPIYGRKQIQGQKPFRATLRDGVWTITGSLPPNVAGGVAEADISKRDGRVLRMIHGK